ncbi:MAG: hypothetical protein OQL09_08795 [Gammaproteobacteria bacterium]|nr:hypothetical protein [Gammaproteobacteria bacterium]
MNKRNTEASILREFFQEQIDYLQRLLDARQQDKLRQKQEKAELVQAIESLIEGTDSRLRLIGSYQKMLRNSTGELLNHIQSLVSAMPPPLEINRTSLITNHQVSRLFANYEAVQRLFAQSQDIKDFFNSEQYRDCDEVYALLFMNMREKNILGADIENDMVVRDVQQTHINFYGHQLISARTNEEEVRQAMKQTLFESVIKYLKIQITHQRHQLSDEEKIKHANNPDLNINNPEVYIKMLCQQLSKPTTLIGLQGNQIRVSNMCVKLPLESASSSDVLQLYELEVGDHTRLVNLVRYPRSEFELRNL